MKQMTAMVTLKTYFEMTMEEAKAELPKLTSQEREELALLAAVEMGTEVIKAARS